MTLDPHRILREARLALDEATLEVPDGDVSAMRRVIAGAIKRRALPLAAAQWWADDSTPKRRRATDRSKPGLTHAVDSHLADTDAVVAHLGGKGLGGPQARTQPEPRGGAVTSRRTGRTIPATNSFVQQARAARDAEPRPHAAGGRDGDAEDFPDFGAPRSAATDVGYPSDDRVLSRDILGGPDDDGSIDVPEPGGGRTVRTIKPADRPSRGGSIAGLFKRRPPDGRKQLDKALKAADRDARRKTGKQGMLGRLVRGRDVTR